MSIDKSLKRKSGANTNRSVMKRTERILKMMEDGAWVEGTSPFGIPKTRVQKLVVKKKVKAEKTDDAAAPAAGAKAAAPKK